MALRLRRRRRRMQYRRECRSRNPRKAWQSFGTGSRPVSNKYIAASCKFGVRRFGLTHGQSDCAALG
eukprot:152063-Pyramimonas_sp.AAC.1